MNPGTARQYNSSYYRQSQPPPPEDTIWARVIKPNIMVYGIIAACIIVFIIELVDYEATYPFMMWPTETMPWMFVTSIFMHGGFEHIFFNMLMLFMFGVTLERMIGGKWFLFVFLTAGIVGNLGYLGYCMATGNPDPAIGASGAIYGVFACLTVLAPQIRVYLFFFIPLRIVHALILFAAIDILFFSANDNVAHAAHLAGLVVGLAFAFYIKKLIRERQAYTVSYEFNTQY
jgi:membrane associated rhomboid family serine protease